MYPRIVVPLDGSAMAARAVVVARAVAEASYAPLLAVTCLGADDRRAAVRAQLDDSGCADVELRAIPAPEAIAPALAALLDEEPGALVVMASTARPRTAAIVGSVAEELLRRASQPVLLVGPHADLDGYRLSGPVLVPVDGSRTSEAAVPLAGSWAVAFALRPWVVSFLDQRASEAAAAAARAGGPLEAAYVRRVARRLEEQAGVPVDFDVLHDGDPASAVTAEARRQGATLICVSTHGHTGARRVALGSVAIAIVHHAPCPVLVTRPPWPGS